MPKITEEHRERRRNQILDAALRCFADRGFQSTSMADIISASGLSAGAIYLYFEGKWELALAVARRVAGGPLDEPPMLDPTGAPLSPPELIRALGAGLDRNGIPPGLIVQIWGEAATDPKFEGIPEEVFRMLNARFDTALTRWFIACSGCSESEAHERAQELLPAVLSFSQGYLLQRALMPAFDEERYLAAVDRLTAAVARPEGV